MTLFILTHIKRFFIVFQTNYWTDVFVVRLLAGRGDKVCCSTVLRKTESTLSALRLVRNSR